MVQSGWVKLYRVSTNGDEAVLATLHDGQSFDEIAALQAGTSPASAEAVSECSVIMLDLTLIHRCEHAYREINQAVLSAASAQLDDMLGHIEQLKVQTGTQRLSEFLIDLSDASSGSSELALPYEKTVLAAKLGDLPQFILQTVKRLKQIGVQSKLRQVRISDVSVLKAFAMESAEFS